MGNKARIIMASIMLSTIIGNAVAIAVLPVILGAAAISGVIGYYVGHNIIPSDQYTELLYKYNQLLTSSKQTNDANIREMLLEVYARDENLYSLGADFGEYTKNYAWALAKYTILKSLEEGKTIAEAKAAAKLKVVDYYTNVTSSLVNNFNSTVNLLWSVINDYPNVAGTSTFKVGTYVTVSGKTKPVVAYFDPTKGQWTYPRTYFNFGRYSYSYWFTDKRLTTKSMVIAGKSYTFAVIQYHMRMEYNGPWTHAYYDKGWHEIKFAKMSEIEVFNNTKFYQAINSINKAYNEIINEIDAYADALATSVDLTQINITDYLDPYIMASQFNTDLNESGYTGYAAAEIALFGLNTAGLNKTVSIQIGNKTLSGWIFTSWNGVLEVNKTYDASNGDWFIVTESGIYKIPSGTIFKVVSLQDVNGNTLTNTTLKSYTSSLTDTTKIYQELQALRQLWEEYLQLQPTVSGGGASTSNSLTQWWNSLDTLGKLGVIGIGAIGVYAVLRRK